MRWPTFLLSARMSSVKGREPSESDILTSLLPLGRSELCRRRLALDGATKEPILMEGLSSRLPGVRSPPVHYLLTVSFFYWTLEEESGRGSSAVPGSRSLLPSETRDSLPPCV